MSAALTIHQLVMAFSASLKVRQAGKDSEEAVNTSMCYEITLNRQK
jgi:hypothetical protein